MAEPGHFATQLAQRNAMADLVEAVSGKGLGFVLRDLPDPTLADHFDEESLSQLTMLWWQLAACAEMNLCGEPRPSAAAPGRIHPSPCTRDRRYRSVVQQSLDTGSGSHRLLVVAAAR
ncbi:MAG: hypothetical protein AAES65_02320 [Candidatus Thiodiazotropha sp. (ex. Lucinoma kazani)]